LFCSNDAQAKRFHDILKDKPILRIYESNTTRLLPLYQGFVDDENQITCYTHQIFERTINSASKRLFEKQNITLKELTTLSVGIM
jgi:transcription-repair coupling factor (superfamily II helicase)